jgi:hypothetical protein
MLTLKDIDLLDVGHQITMVGALFAGKGRVLAVLLPDREDEAQVAPVELLHMTLDDWKAFLAQTDTLATEVFLDGSGQKAILRKANRDVDAKVSWAVYRRDGYRCRYCGRNDMPLTVDHLVLWEERGPWAEENLVSACSKDNKARGRTPYADWLQSDWYRRVSQGLTPEVRAANEALVATLDRIPRVVKMRSR